MEYKKYGFQFWALGGSNELQLYAHFENEAVRVARELIKRVQALEKKYSRYLDDSVVTEINRGAGGPAIKVDDETADLIDFASMCCAKSTGLFDISSGVLRRIWNFKEAKVPSAMQVAESLKNVGWQFVEWKRPYIRLTRPEMEIDFGGIGKEYATDLLAEICINCGINHALINLGGDLRVVGPHPDGSPWRLGIRDPRDQSKILRVINLYQGSLATSGDYERYFEFEGKRYCHILNPKTGFPTSESRTVSVIAPTCLQAGSLSTISMLLPSNQARSLLESESLQYFMVDGDGIYWDQSGFKSTSGCLQRLDESYAT